MTTKQLTQRLEAIKAFKTEANQLKAIEKLEPTLKKFQDDFTDWLEDNSYSNRHNTYLAINVKLRNNKAFLLDSDEAEELGLSEFNTDSYWRDWIEQNQSYIKDVLSIGKDGLHIFFEKDSIEYKHIATLTYWDERIYFLGRSGGWLCFDKLYNSLCNSMYESYTAYYEQEYACLDTDTPEKYCEFLMGTISYVTEIQEAFEWLKSYMADYIAGMDFSEELKFRAECELELANSYQTIN